MSFLPPIAKTSSGRSEIPPAAAPAVPARLDRLASISRRPSVSTGLSSLIRSTTIDPAELRSLYQRVERRPPPAVLSSQAFRELLQRRLSRSSAFPPLSREREEKTAPIPAVEAPRVDARVGRKIPVVLETVVEAVEESDSHESSIEIGLDEDVGSLPFMLPPIHDDARSVVPRSRLMGDMKSSWINDKSCSVIS